LPCTMPRILRLFFSSLRNLLY